VKFTTNGTFTVAAGSGIWRRGNNPQRRLVSSRSTGECYGWEREKGGRGSDQGRNRNVLLSSAVFINHRKRPFAGVVGDDRAEGFVAEDFGLVRHAGGNAQGVAGFQNDGFFADALFASARQHINDFVGVDVDMKGIGFADVEFGEAEGQAGAGVEFAIDEPAKGAPGGGVRGDLFGGAHAGGERGSLWVIRGEDGGEGERGDEEEGLEFHGGKLNTEAHAVANPKLQIPNPNKIPMRKMANSGRSCRLKVEGCKLEDR
jgi:hypothetical protein